MHNLYLDIETIPSQEPWVREYIEEKITPPGNIKKPESIENWIYEKKPQAVEDAYRKTSLDGAMCHIVAIGWAVDGDKAKCVLTPGHKNEKVILRNFFDLCDDLSYPTVIGHNVNGFDMKILRQRAMILGVKIPSCLPWAAKPWELNPYDTMVQWDAKNFISMDKLAKAMGVKGKDGIDGSMVYDLWKDGEHDKLADYCKSDVDMVRQIHQKMTGVR